MKFVRNSEFCKLLLLEKEPYAVISKFSFVSPGVCSMGSESKTSLKGSFSIPSLTLIYSCIFEVFNGLQDDKYCNLQDMFKIRLLWGNASFASLYNFQISCGSPTCSVKVSSLFFCCCSFKLYVSADIVMIIIIIINCLLFIGRRAPCGRFQERRNRAPHVVYL